MKILHHRPKPGEITAAQFARLRPALLRSGLTEIELQMLDWHDIERLSFSQMAARDGRSDHRMSQLYWRARRRLSHPIRRRLAPKAWQKLTAD